MAWARFTHASVDPSNPRAFGVCDRCGFVYNRDQLNWDYQWAGATLQNLRVLVCPTCSDVPQEQLRTILIPPDPVPIQNPRPGEFSGMVISSAPGNFDSAVISQRATVNSSAVLVTASSSGSLILEAGVTPTPTSSGYTDNVNG